MKTKKKPLIIIKEDKKTVLKFYTPEQWGIFIKLDEALNKPTEYSTKYGFNPVSNLVTGSGIGKALMPKLLRKALKNPIII
ncbi:hypothetical protein [endosymbiont GvMRE of Glomus versiforme]|uniref:hypothetical protein n=1 Tax=endosymbiont GvMRE of Glomus versiforme TaxID=2039283 RepID=UPI000ECC3F71|nr:hypothetical protein [endosymbiont GvMRE of Glomus versiforme]RHZ37204.1 hypothetical protein GvMRE_I1g487 [endosymbiont GvMRE of Glomus versiforme]